jgi:prolyl 4-hydroxylase
LFVSVTGAEEDQQNTSDRIAKMDAYMRKEVWVDPKYEKVKKHCKNKHENCSYWAFLGECDANPGYMVTNCAPACMTCLELSFEHRCPTDPDLPNAWEKGDVNKFFERITTEPFYQQYKPEIIARPGIDNPKIGPSPWVVTLDEFLTEEECETLIQLGAVQGYERSEDVGPEQFDGSLAGVQSKGRTSTNAWWYVTT